MQSSSTAWQSYTRHLGEPAATPDWKLGGFTAQRTAALAPDAQRSDSEVTIVKHPYKLPQSPQNQVRSASLEMITSLVFKLAGF
jgi:hypothetical protein